MDGLVQSDISVITTVNTPNCIPLYYTTIFWHFVTFYISALEILLLTSYLLTYQGRINAFRLRILDLPTLKFRRLRGDMIETYKVLSGYYDTTVSPVYL